MEIRTISELESVIQLVPTRKQLVQVKTTLRFTRTRERTAFDGGYHRQGPIQPQDPEPSDQMHSPTSYDECLAERAFGCSRRIY